MGRPTKYDQYLVEFTSYPRMNVARRRDLKEVPKGTKIDTAVITKWEMEKEAEYASYIKKPKTPPLIIVARYAKLGTWKANEWEEWKECEDYGDTDELIAKVNERRRDENRS
jgi:hypothetical protein